MSWFTNRAGGDGTAEPLAADGSVGSVMYQLQQQPPPQQQQQQNQSRFSAVIVSRGAEELDQVALDFHTMAARWSSARRAQGGHRLAGRQRSAAGRAASWRPRFRLPRGGPAAPPRRARVVGEGLADSGFGSCGTTVLGSSRPSGLGATMTRIELGAVISRGVGRPCRLLCLAMKQTMAWCAPGVGRPGRSAVWVLLPKFHLPS